MTRMAAHTRQRQGLRVRRGEMEETHWEGLRCPVLLSRMMLQPLPRLSSTGNPGHSSTWDKFWAYSHSHSRQWVDRHNQAPRPHRQSPAHLECASANPSDVRANIPT